MRREIGRWFQTVGAAKEKDLRPSSDLIKGTESKKLEEDLRDLEGRIT